MTAARLPTLIASLILTLTAPAFAQYTGAVAAGTAAGIAAANASSPTQLSPDPELGDDLAAFEDPGSGRSSRLETGCGGVTTELGVSSTPLFNYLNLAVANQTDGDFTLVLDATRVRFGDGRVRRLERMLPSDVALPHGWWVQYAMRFPDKADFEGQSSFDIDVQLMPESGERCTITTHFAREPSRALDARTYTRFWAFEIELAGGVRLLSTSGLHALGADWAPLLDLGFGWYPWLHHGFRIDMGGGTFGDDGVDRVVAAGSVFDGKPRIVPFELLLSYSFRAFLTPWLQATYDLGGGVYALQLVDDSSEPIESETLLVPRQQLRLAATLANFDASSDFALGLSLTHFWALAGRLGAAETHGHSLGVMLHVIVGGGL